MDMPNLFSFPAIESFYVSNLRSVPITIRTEPNSWNLLLMKSMKFVASHIIFGMRLDSKIYRQSLQVQLPAHPAIYINYVEEEPEPRFARK